MFLQTVPSLLVNLHSDPIAPDHGYSKQDMSSVVLRVLVQTPCVPSTCQT